MKKQTKLISPAYSFRGYSFMTLLEKHRDGVIAFLSFVVFTTLFIRMLVIPTEVSYIELVAQPAAAAGVVWTMLHGWLYFKNEKRE